ncbi:hypothetical protein D3C71_277850 [compost metagenome]
MNSIVKCKLGVEMENAAIEYEVIQGVLENGGVYTKVIDALERHGPPSGLSGEAEITSWPQIAALIDQKGGKVMYKKLNNRQYEVTVVAG